MKYFSAGGSQDWERSHQPQGCGTGWFSGPVQNQEAHTPQQTNEGILWTTGNLTVPSPHFETLQRFTIIVKPLQWLALHLLLWHPSCCHERSLHTPCPLMFIAWLDFLQGLAIRQIRFRFDGQPINETDTPAQVVRVVRCHEYFSNLLLGFYCERYPCQMWWHRGLVTKTLCFCTGEHWK